MSHSALQEGQHCNLQVTSQPDNLQVLGEGQPGNLRSSGS